MIVLEKSKANCTQFQTLQSLDIYAQFHFGSQHNLNLKLMENSMLFKISIFTFVTDLERTCKSMISPCITTHLYIHDIPFQHQNLKQDRKGKIKSRYLMKIFK